MYISSLFYKTLTPSPPPPQKKKKKNIYIYIYTHRNLLVLVSAHPRKKVAPLDSSDPRGLALRAVLPFRVQGFRV